MTAERETLPPKQRQVLDALSSFIRENGYPPSIQQLCRLCGVSSTSTIHHHVTALKKKGFIHWNAAEKRAICINPDVIESPGKLPILGAIAAGQPLQTVTDSVETLNLSEDLCPIGCYALRVRGDSMIEDHILDGDMVIINPKAAVRDGDVVVALVEGESTTLKRIYREPERVRLQPANAAMGPIYATDVQVQGKVEAVIRHVT
ncbi:MAG: repressor LexA [Vampirovibrionales bacterium]|nr:repressor LexA [Vampirovibrionales bacterium]